jgi:TRAP-type mannitol/chloroaromatic compound transport system permease small subunit
MIPLLKSMLLLMPLLVSLQGISIAIRSVATIRRNR